MSEPVVLTYLSSCYELPHLTDISSEETLNIYSTAVLTMVTAATWIERHEIISAWLESRSYPFERYIEYGIVAGSDCPLASNPDNDYVLILHRVSLTEEHATLCRLSVRARLDNDLDHIMLPYRTPY